MKMALTVSFPTVLSSVPPATSLPPFPATVVTGTSTRDDDPPISHWRNGTLAFPKRNGCSKITTINRPLLISYSACCGYKNKHMKSANICKNASRGWFRSIDLWVMGPARSHCATLLPLHTPTTKHTPLSIDMEHTVCEPTALSVGGR